MNRKAALIVSERGFTLLEIMVVVVIIGLLSTFVGLKLMSNIDVAKVTKAAVQIDDFKKAVQMFRLDNGFYPSTQQGIDALIKKPGVGTIPQRYRANGYMEGTEAPKDPWDNPYSYICPGTHGDYDISSNGPDGQPNTEDDINSWTKKQ